MHTQRVHGTGLLASAIIAITALTFAHTAQAVTTTAGRATTWLSSNVGVNGIGNGASSDASQDPAYPLPRDPAMHSWHSGR